jgi:hypothetical protein
MTGPIFMTKALGRHPAVELSLHTDTLELLTIAPGQTCSDSLELVGSEADLAAIRDHRPSTLPKESAALTIGESVIVERSTGTRAPVTIKGVTGGTCAFLGPASLFPRAGQIARFTVGTHERHLGAGGVDLLAAISNGTDARKIVAIQQILHNQRKGIIDQFDGAYGSKATFACGDVALNAGGALFGKIPVGYDSYHKRITLPPRGAKLGWEQITYDEARMGLAISTIRGLLSKGTAVRVGVVYDPKAGMVAANGALQPTSDGGHFVLIVGFNDDKFLYLDPYPAGSITEYKGGLSFNRRKKCGYLGVFEVVRERGLHLRSAAETSGELVPYEVIAGP